MNYDYCLFKGFWIIQFLHKDSWYVESTHILHATPSLLWFIAFNDMGLLKSHIK